MVPFVKIDARVNFIAETVFCSFWRCVSPEIEFSLSAMKSVSLTHNIGVPVAKLCSLHRLQPLHNIGQFTHS